MVVVDLLLSVAMPQSLPLTGEKFLRRGMTPLSPIHKSFPNARNVCTQAAFRHLYKSVYVGHTTVEGHDDAVFQLLMQLVQV